MFALRRRAICGAGVRTRWVTLFREKVAAYIHRARDEACCWNSAGVTWTLGTRLTRLRSGGAASGREWVEEEAPQKCASTEPAACPERAVHCPTERRFGAGANLGRGRRSSLE